MSTSLGTLEETRGLRERGVTLFYAGDVVVEAQVSGHFYRFEPHSPKEIHDRKEQPFGRDMRRLKGAPPVVPDGGRAEVIADILLEKMQDKGVCRIMHDDRDPERKAAARERHITWRSSRATDIQAHWNQVVARATTMPGAMPPRMPDKVRTEIEFLRDVGKDGVSYVMRPFVCRVDGSDFETYEEAIAWVNDIHADRVAREGNPDGLILDRRPQSVKDAEAAQRRNEQRAARPVAADGTREIRPIADRAPEPVPDPEALDPAALATEVAPTQAGPSDARWLLRKARELEVALGPAELEGIIDGDDITIQNVTVKLAEAGASKRRGARA